MKNSSASAILMIENRWRKWLFLLAVFLVGALLSLRVSVDDDALDLLPDGPVKEDLHLLQRLGLVDRIFITLSMEKPGENDQEKLKKSVTRLGRLLRESSSFSLVMDRLEPGYESRLYTMFSPWLPVLLERDDLAALKKKLTPASISRSMEKLFTLLNSPAGIAVKKQVRSDPLGLTGLLLGKLSHLRSEFSMRLVDGFFMSSDSSHALVMAESVFSLTDSKNAEKIEAELEIFLQKSLASGVTASIIGTLPHTLANSRTIQHDLKRLLPLATILLLFLLAVTLRDIRVIPVLGVVFMAALPAIGVTSLVFGHVSGLALGFGIVLLGIGVDFSIHLFLALGEQGERRKQLRALRRPVFFAWLTTATVLAVLLFSAVPSHRQMATLALAGVSLAVLFSWLIIPEIVSRKKNDKPVLPDAMAHPQKACEDPDWGSATPGREFSDKPAWPDSMARPQKANENPNCGDTTLSRGFSDKRRRKGLVPGRLTPFTQKCLLMFWGLLLISGLTVWPQLHYNGDLRVLDAPDHHVEAAEKHFRDIWGGKGDQAFIVSSGENLDIALENNSMVYRFLKERGIGPFQSLAPLLPGGKIQRENVKQWRQFWRGKRPEFDHVFLGTAAEFGFSEGAFAPFFRTLDREPGLLQPEKIEKSPLRSMAASMIRSPGRAAERDRNNNFLVMTTVSIHGDDLQVLHDWAESNPHVTLLANRIWRAEVEQSLEKDMMTLCLAAGCGVIILVGLQFRRFDGMLAVLAPVLSALSAMSIFCFLTGVELNMMHLIMGIMVIGLSVDYGIFVVCAHREKQYGTTLKAVSICAASSLIGFGVLAFAAHPALHALGITVLVGIGTAWPVALFVSPTLLQYGEQ
ncbi:MMPL family transporter [Desulfomarina sp.]